MGAFACVAVLGVRFATRPVKSLPGATFNQGTNAAWLGVEWVSEPRSPEEVRALARELDSREIRLLFVFTSYLKPGVGFTSGYQYADTFTTITQDTWQWLQEQAVNKINDLKTQEPELRDAISPDVIRHWNHIAAGNVPFGYTVASKPEDPPLPPKEKMN